MTTPTGDGMREALEKIARWESWEETGDLVELPPAPREIRVLWRKNNPTIQ